MLHFLLPRHICSSLAAAAAAAALKLHKEMRGAGGPLLCIGDLLSDVGEADGGSGSSSHHSNLQPSFSPSSSPSLSTSLPSSDLNLQPSDLPKLFQETYDQLNEALAGTDHSWTALTLKLCTALETANQLVQSTNANVGVLSEKIQELERIAKRGDTAVAAAKAFHSSLNQKEGSSS